jgi:hypothetical protein
MGERYLTIKLTLTQLRNHDSHVEPKDAETWYRARIEQSPLGASRGPGWDFKLNPEDWATINQFVAKMPSRESLGKPEVTTLGQKLFSLIFREEVAAKYNQCIGRLTNGIKLRLAIAILAEELVNIPWEYLHDGNGFLLQSNHLIVRIIDELAERKAPFGPIGRLLVAIANPGKDNPDAQFDSFDAQGHEQTIVERLGPTGIDYEILNPCSRQKFKDKITSGQFVALYFAGHGIFTPNLEGQLILEDSKNGEDPLDAAELAQWLGNPDQGKSAQRVRFAYLNSCSTAKNTSPNPFAGVAQRIMRDGNVDAVVAMQTDVEQTAAFDIAAGFFEELRLQRGKSPEQAMALARMKGGDAHSWGVPAIYSYLSGPEDFDKNRLAYFLSADTGSSTYGVFMPTFIFGALVGEIKGEVGLSPPQDYFYPGETLAMEDTRSALDVINLLTQIVSPDEIKLWRATDQKEAQCSHWFLFGSRSNKIVQSVLGITDYHPRFKFEYAPADQPGKWMIRDIKLNQVHSIDAPHNSKKGEYDEKDDIGVIEKIVSIKTGRVFFLLSGLGDRATRGCGWHLYKHWADLLGEFGNAAFGIVLKFRGGFGFDDPERLDKEAGTQT